MRLAATGKLLAPPLPHRGGVLGVAFRPDGRHVATASDDTTARVWDLPLDDGTLADWSATAERSPYLLVNGVLVRRPSR